MEKVKEQVKCLTEIGEKLADILKIEACNTNPNEIDYENSGGVADIIKDLSEAKMNLWKALYYKTICEAMQKGSQEMMEGSYGHGNQSMGFMPEYMIEGEFYPGMMGYGSSGGRGGSSGGSSGGRGGSSSGRGSSGENGGNSGGGGGRSGYRPMNSEWNPEYGESYNHFLEARRHYNESGRKEDMDEMDTHAMQHIKSAVKGFEEIYRNGSPSTKKALKEDLTKLIGEM